MFVITANCEGTETNCTGKSASNSSLKSRTFFSKNSVAFQTTNFLRCQMVASHTPPMRPGRGREAPSGRQGGSGVPGGVSRPRRSTGGTRARSGGGLDPHQVFYVKSAPVKFLKRRHNLRILYQKTQTQRALPERHGKTRESNCRPPDYTARDGLHIADGAKPWCGPARRLANPCFARTSGAPSCALFHSPIPGPGNVTRYSAHVFWRPRFSQRFPHRWCYREPACPASASAGNR